MIPDWSQAADWAMYWAMDADGTECWYETEPYLCGERWMAEGGARVKVQMLGGTSWQELLQPRPEATDAEERGL